MAELHEALTQLAHIDWEDVPQANLSGFLSPLFSAGELLINSVPLPPNGTPFESARPYFDAPNTAKSAKDIYPSPARPKHPHNDHASLQKNWGKPMKYGQKENPLSVALYKMAGHDRHGAWFARHNVIEGIGFSKMKKAMQREFPETLLTRGAPGAGAIRGLSAERRVERKEADGVGRLEVYQLTAQMPSPVTAREFLTLFLTTDQGLTEKSPCPDQGGEKYVPRHFMVVSKAMHHPDAPERSSYVRGSYESVELMREIPLHLSGQNDPELNPIEWIMVTRSDPGGGIPRFLIDRGTPGAMLEDVTKFLNWACSYEEIPDPDADVEKQQQASEEAKQEVEQEDEAQLAQATENVRRRSASLGNKTSEHAVQNNATHSDMSIATATTDGTEESTPLSPEPVTALESPSQAGGMFSNVAGALEAGVNSYAPAPVSNFVQRQLHPEDTPAAELSDSDSSSSSYLSADEIKRLSTAPEHLERDPAETVSVASVASAASSVRSANVDQKNLSPQDKEVLKIMQQREKLDEKLTKKRQAEEAKFQQAQEKEQSEQGKAKERLDKEMKKTEERHRREVEKLEAKREKELKNAEERRKKRDEQSRLTTVARERDDLRSQANLLRRENSLLADQVEALQRENNALAAQLGKVGGPDAVNNVLTELKKSGSNRSHLSLVSSGSGDKKEASSTHLHLGN